MRFNRFVIQKHDTTHARTILDPRMNELNLCSRLNPRNCLYQIGEISKVSNNARIATVKKAKQKRERQNDIQHNS